LTVDAPKDPTAWLRSGRQAGSRITAQANAGQPLPKAQSFSPPALLTSGGGVRWGALIEENELLVAGLADQGQWTSREQGKELFVRDNPWTGAAIRNRNGRVGREASHASGGPARQNWPKNGES